MSAIQFRFGLSLDGHPVNIKDAAKGKSYTCVNCGKPLIAKQGKVREWHFAHKTNTSNCSFETYLHKLAKYFIREMFNEKQSLVATLGKVTQTCYRMHECPFRKDNSCLIIKDESIDLLQYTACVEEASINGFTADLLFTSDTLDPLLIEIYVTHPCTEEKIKSGLKIIEIHIESETDVERLIEGRLTQSKKVVFYNFNINDRPTLSSDCSGHHLFHGYVINEHFEEGQENCKKAFWPNSDYLWELYSDEHTQREFLEWDYIRHYRICSSCYWCSVQSKGKGLCCVKHDFVSIAEKACSNHLINVKTPSICHQEGKSYIYHYPQKIQPQRLNKNNT